MYNYSGIIYRLLSPCGVMFELGVVLLLLERPWKFNYKSINFKAGIFEITFSICLALMHLYNIICPDIKVYTGDYLYEHRDSRSAPPLPFTMEYTFWNGEGYKYSFELDVFSKKEIYPEDFIVGQEYTIYYEAGSNVIIRVEVVE